MVVAAVGEGVGERRVLAAREDDEREEGDVRAEEGVAQRALDDGDAEVLDVAVLESAAAAQPPLLGRTLRPLLRLPFAA